MTRGTMSTDSPNVLKMHGGAITLGWPTAKVLDALDIKPDEVWFVVEGKVVGKIVGIGDVHVLV